MGGLRVVFLQFVKTEWMLVRLLSGWTSSKPLGERFVQDA